jgi:mRNA interferase RelE/StbE
MIYAWIGKNLDGCTNPYLKGKPLVREHKGSWRYRIGSYRIIVEIKNDKLIILVLAGTKTTLANLAMQTGDQHYEFDLDQFLPPRSEWAEREVDLR